MTTPAPTAGQPHPESPFAGTDVCRIAGLSLPTGAPRQRFDDDVWDFGQVIGLPVQMVRSSRRFDFSPVTDPRWRLVAKELVLALLAPRHLAVAPLPGAYRTPLHLRTARLRLDELTRFFQWLTGWDTSGLGEVDSACCDAYLAYRRHIRDETGTVIGERSPATRRAAAQVVVDLISYRELFTADRVTAGLRPFAGATPSAIAEMKSGRHQNLTSPVAGEVLQPMLAAALYLVTTLGTHAAGLDRQLREAHRQWSPAAGCLAEVTAVPTAGITRVLAGYERTGEPLPLLPDHHIQARLAAGWPPDDPLTPIALSHLAHQAGFARFRPGWIPKLRPRIEATLDLVGAERWFGRSAAGVDRADGQDGALPWTLPLHRQHALALVGIVRTATLLVTATVSGMRSSELMELLVGCRRPAQPSGPGLIRYRLASKVIKGQPLGGTDDEWVVVEPVYRAVQLAEQLHDDPQDGALLFGRFAFDIRYRWFCDWVNGPAGQRLGLASIPSGNVTLRALRRTLAIELAYRPGGVLAAKIHLKHLSVATTEGYASRPGGAQGELLAEVNKHEADHKLAMVLQEFRNYQQGILPAGPGARELTEFFAHVDGGTAQAAGAPKVQRTDREILNLLSRRAGILHLQAANYCWFADPARALCLILAGRTDATEPLAGMCDSARCPQATHHSVHRQVWADQEKTTTIFLGQLDPRRTTEKARLQDDQKRARRVLNEIDRATGPQPAPKY